MKSGLLLSILLVAATIFTSPLTGQHDNYINANAVFDLGVTTGQLNYCSNEGIAVDFYETWAERLIKKYENSIDPAPESMSIDAFDTESFDPQVIESRINNLANSFDCNNPYLKSIIDIYYSGFYLAQAYLTAGTDCTACLANALIEAESSLQAFSDLSIASNLTNQGLNEIIARVRNLYSALDYSLDGDTSIAQNALAGQNIIHIIGQVNQVFPDQYFDCSLNVKETNSESSSCTITELTAIAEDSIKKTFVARGEAEIYQWRYRIDGGAWQYASESDSIFILHKEQNMHYEVQVQAWCESVIDFSGFIDESITYNYSYGCYAPGYHDLWVSHVNQSSAYLHCKTYYNKLQWAYRQAGGNWKYFTTGSKTIRYSGLQPGTKYEFACKIWCGSSWTSWSPTRVFTTPGGYNCTVYRPSVHSVTSNSAITKINHSGKKQWKFRKKGGSWKYYTNSYSWMKWNCNPNTTYEVCVRIPCHGKWSSWSSPTSWTTSGGSCYPPSSGSISIYNINTTTATTYVNVTSNAYKCAIRKKGGYWEYFTDNDPTFNWKGLSPNTTYEVKAAVYCGGHWTYYSSIRQFTTKGYSCYAPTNSQIWYSYLTSSSVTLNISTSAKTVEYALRRYDRSDWWSWTRDLKSLKITGMSSNTKYYYRMRVYCNGSWSNWSPQEYFITKYSGRTADHPETENPLAEGEQPTYLGDLANEFSNISQDSDVKSVDLPALASNSEENVPEIVLYPNPATDYLRIKGIESEVSVQIINLQGQMILSKEQVTDGESIDLQPLRSGQYQVSILYNGKREIRKLSVVR